MATAYLTIDNLTNIEVDEIEKKIQDFLIEKHIGKDEDGAQVNCTDSDYDEEDEDDESD